MAKSTTKGLLEALWSKTSLNHLILVVVWTRLGWLEAKTIQQVNIRFGARGLVICVADGRDLLQAQVLAELVLCSKDALHDSVC